MRLSRYGSWAVLNVVDLVALAARGDEKPVEVKDLPVVVRQAAEKAVVGAKWTEAVSETEDDGTTYRVKGTDTKGGKVEVTLSADGRVKAVATASRLDDLKELPVEVRKAAEQSAPSGVKWAELVVRAEGDEITYRLKGTDAKGRKVEAAFAVEVHVPVCRDRAGLQRPAGAPGRRPQAAGRCEMDQRHREDRRRRDDPRGHRHRLERS